MTDNNAFERFVADHLADDGSGIAQAERLAALIDDRTGERRQWPRWLALIKEPPMRTNSHLTVGSPTVRLAAILAATMLLAVALAAAGVAGQQLLAADGAIVVAQDGSGSHETISEAVTAAEDGVEIRVRPGTYAESVITDKDIHLVGDGEPEDIIITFIEDAPSYRTGFSWKPSAEYALVLVGSEATVSDLTFSGEHARLFIDGGAPLIEGVNFDDVGNPYTGGVATQAIVIKGGATPTIRANSLVDGGGINIFEESSPLIERNELEGGPGIYGHFGDDTVIVDNHFFGSGEQGIDMGAPAAATIRGNTVEDKTDGMYIMGDAIVTDNTIRGSRTYGISVDSPLGEPTLRSNRLIDNDTAISWRNAPGMIEGNEISGGRSGLLIGSGSPVVDDNVIEGVDGRGLAIGAHATPDLAGNRSCGNGTNLVVMENASPAMADTNEICEDVVE